VVSIFFSNKWRSCPNKSQLDFFEGSVAYVEINSVIGMSASYFQYIFLIFTKNAVDALCFW